jgi:Fur family transcriptional regulator, ferric uptake regulator
MMERKTRQREVIRALLTAAGRPLSTPQILEEARRELPKLGIATVYRTIKGLLAQGEIVSVHLPGDNPYYERAGLHHHHHFRCRACDRVFELHGCPPGLAALTPKGFAVESHEITLRGLCATCND